MEYRIDLTQSAKADIDFFSVHDQRKIVAGILTHIGTDAEMETRRKKKLRLNPLAPWELRIDAFRVFYSVEGGNRVKVLAVAHKDHNELYIRGRKVEL